MWSLTVTCQANPPCNDVMAWLGVGWGVVLHVYHHHYMQCSLSQTFLFWDSQIEICEHGLFPDDVSTIFMKFSLKSSASPFSSLAMSPSFPILIQSFSMQLLFVKKGFTVFEKVLLDITPLLVASLKNFLLDFLVTELHELHLFLAFCKL